MIQVAKMLWKFFGIFSQKMNSYLKSIWTQTWMVNGSIIHTITHQNKIVGTKTISIHINTSRLQVLQWQRPGNNVFTKLYVVSKWIREPRLSDNLRRFTNKWLSEAWRSLTYNPSQATTNYLPISCSVGESQIYVLLYTIHNKNLSW